MKVSSLLKWGFGAFLLLILAGIFLSDYSSGRYLGIGVSIVIGVGAIGYFLGWKRTILIVAIVSIALMIYIKTRPVIIPITVSPIIIVSCPTGTKRSELELTKYTAEIEPIKFSKGSFRVTEHLTYNKREEICGEEGSQVVLEGLEQDLPSRNVQSSACGLFMQEVVIPVELKDYRPRFDKAYIVIKGFPYNSFYDAQYVDNIINDEYLGTETVTMQTSYWSDGIRFAYLPSPFHNLRVLISPFIELSKNENWILTGIGFVISSLFLLIVKPNIIGILNDKVKAVFKKDADAPQRKLQKRRMNRNQ